MKNILIHLAIYLSLGSLVSCAVLEERRISPYSTYDVSQYNPQSHIEAYGYEGGTYSASVPDTYHVGPNHSPITAKDRDQSWVTSQNPTYYTIEIAEDEKPAQVANRLLQLPKTNRTAEIKFQHGDKMYYKGLYGSYQNAADAQKALNALPVEIKHQANIKTWKTIQNESP